MRVTLTESVPHFFFHETLRHGADIGVATLLKTVEAHQFALATVHRHNLATTRIAVSLTTHFMYI